MRQHRQPPGFPFLIVTMLGCQSLGTAATMLVPVIAPKVAETYGVSSSLVGYQISLLAGAMLVSLVFGGNFSTRWGACRVTQAGLALLAGGCVVATLPHIAFVFAAAIALGLGYGLLSPAASHLLMRFTPAERRNLIFSMKQTGVPIGGIVAATLGPLLAVTWGWRTALWLDAAFIAALMALLQRGRAHWDDDRQPAARAISNPLGGIATVWSHRALRLLSLSGGWFVMAQIGISTFTVIFFAEELGYSLIEAGAVLTASQVGGVAGRVFWGWLADALRNCYTALGVLGAAMLAAALLCAFVTPAWPLVAACALFFVFGSTASGWNGAFLAEVARLAPAGRVSSATSGSLFFVNIGKMLGPIAVASAYGLSGRYSLAFALLAVPTLLGLACVLGARSAPHGAAPFTAARVQGEAQR
jgi:predicted MFS family arabinose efflux permease